MVAAAGSDLITLDLAMAEAGSVVWKQVLLLGESLELLPKSFKNCQRFIARACELLRGEELAVEAIEISIENKIAFQASLFLAGAALVPLTS
ncbi:MAG: hypothetical protein IPI63_02095 [Methanothrix sp.]|jgi:predicted nucleic acid-binding protein|uniref:hypothetical protein n=1 Tax=Methanothrix sp. TaxID=90426 RepID=UPI0025FD8ADB|nr:hypothetical protein [Methanothrix sp.]MBK7385568.1 hypothetical protein [Methanothrix sp.]HPW72672.1 hypothetical protein [Methanothrix sp.]